MANAKISELTRAGALGAGLLIPAAQGGANFGVPATQLMPSRPFVQLWTDGDSKAGEGSSAALWALARDPREVWVTRSFGVGGSSTSSAASPLGLTNATRMATITTALQTAVAAGSIVDVILTVGTNDAGNGALASEAIIANIRKYHNNIRAAGARFLILMAIDPRSSLTTATARNVVSTNRAYADYCEAIPDAIFCDPTGWWLDPASALFGPVGGAGGTAFAMTTDGLHGSGYGSYAKQFSLQPIFQQIYRPRAFDTLNAGDAYNATDALRGNILGTSGRFVAMGGTNSITNGGSGSITGTPPASFTASGALNGSMSIAFTAETCAALTTKFGTASWPCVRAALSGTPSANVDITLAQRNVVIAEMGATPMIGRALIACNAVTGLAGLRVSTTNVSPTYNHYLGFGGTVAATGAQDQIPQLDGLFAIDFFYVPTGNLNSGIGLTARCLSGVALGGTIDMIGLDWRRWEAIPAAAA